MNGCECETACVFCCPPLGAGVICCEYRKIINDGVWPPSLERGGLIEACSNCLDESITRENIKMNNGFITKDSGQRQEFSTGMVRDVSTDKPRYDLVDLPLLKRWAELMARGAKKYGENNWRKASTEVELNRFKESALRHMFQWLEGDTTEDHSAAVCFNLAGAEMVKEKLHQIKMETCPF